MPGLLGTPQGQGSRNAAEMRRGPTSKGVGIRRRDWPRALVLRGGLTRREGSRGPSGRALEPSGDSACASLRARAGSRVRGVGGQALERHNGPGEQRPPSRDIPGRCERTHGGNKASEWMKLAERSGSGGSSPRVAGKRASARGKGAHSRQGIQATARERGRR